MNVPTVSEYAAAYQLNCEGDETLNEDPMMCSGAIVCPRPAWVSSCAEQTVATKAISRRSDKGAASTGDDGASWMLVSRTDEAAEGASSRCARRGCNSIELPVSDFSSSIVAAKIPLLLRQEMGEGMEATYCCSDRVYS